MKQPLQMQRLLRLYGTINLNAAAGDTAAACAYQEKKMMISWAAKTTEINAMG